MGIQRNVWSNGASNSSLPTIIGERMRSRASSETALTNGACRSAKRRTFAGVFDVAAREPPSAHSTAAPTLKLGQGARAYPRVHRAISISSFKGIVRKGEVGRYAIVILLYRSYPLVIRNLNPCKITVYGEFQARVRISTAIGSERGLK